MKKNISIFALGLTIFSAHAAFADSDVMNQVTVGAGLNAGVVKQSGDGSLNTAAGGFTSTIEAVGSDNAGIGMGRANIGINGRKGGVNVNTDSYGIVGFANQGSVAPAGKITAYTSDANMLYIPAAGGVGYQSNSGKTIAFGTLAPWGWFNQRNTAIHGNVAALQGDAVIALTQDVALTLNGTAGGIYGAGRGIQTNSTFNNNANCDGMSETCTNNQGVTTSESRSGASGGVGAIATIGASMKWRTGHFLGQDAFLSAGIACDGSTVKAHPDHYVTGTDAATTSCSSKDCSANVQFGVAAD